MSALPRPARRVTPDALYCEFLPQLWTAFAAGRTLSWPPAVELEVRITLEGPDEESAPELFTVRLDSGNVIGRPGPAVAPILTCTLTDEAWRIAVKQVLPRVIAFTETHAERAWNGLSHFIHGRAAAALAAVTSAQAGTVEIRYTDDAGDELTYELSVGGGKGPRATLHVGENDIDAMLDAGGNLPRLFRSRLKVDGDAAYILRLMHALGAQG